MRKDKAVVLLTFISFIALNASAGATVLLWGMLFWLPPFSWGNLILAQINLVICLIMLRIETKAAFSLSTKFCWHGWLSRRLFWVCSAAPAGGVWLAALFLSIALGSIGVLPQRFIYYAFSGFAYMAVFASFLGYKCTVNNE